jgi:hypothetical protein
MVENDIVLALQDFIQKRITNEETLCYQRSFFFITEKIVVQISKQNNTTPARLIYVA